MFVALGMQHVARMRRIVLSSVACLALPYFSHIISQTARTELSEILHLTEKKNCIHALVPESS